MAETFPSGGLHPVVEIKSGNTPVTQIPPEYLQECRFISKTEMNFEIEAVLVDPTYKEIERILLLSDESGNDLRFSFGYPGIRMTEELIARLENYEPSLENAGMRINLRARSSVSSQMSLIPRTSFVGNVSGVIEQIAAVLGEENPNVTLCVEQTDDPQETEWSTNNMSYEQFIRSVLLERANKDQKSTEAFEFWTSGSAIHFHTPSFPCKETERKPIREFTYLRGKNDHLISFIPNVNSRALGALGASGVQGRQFVRENGLYRLVGADKNTNPPVVDDADETNAVPGRQPAVVVASEEPTPETADATIKYYWATLFNKAYSARAVFTGSPELVDLTANEVIKVSVVLPDGTTHPTSGSYRIYRAEHDIKGNYEISCDLKRAYSFEGAESVR